MGAGFSWEQLSFVPKRMVCTIHVGSQWGFDTFAVRRYWRADERNMITWTALWETKWKATDRAHFYVVFRLLFDYISSCRFLCHLLVFCFCTIWDIFYIVFGLFFWLFELMIALLDFQKQCPPTIKETINMRNMRQFQHVGLIGRNDHFVMIKQ